MKAKFLIIFIILLLFFFVALFSFKKQNTKWELFYSHFDYEHNIIHFTVFYCLLDTRHALGHHHIQRQMIIQCNLAISNFIHGQNQFSIMGFNSIVRLLFWFVCWKCFAFRISFHFLCFFFWISRWMFEFLFHGWSWISLGKSLQNPSYKLLTSIFSPFLQLEFGVKCDNSISNWYHCFFVDNERSSIL